MLLLAVTCYAIRSGIRTVSIPVTKDDIICMWGPIHLYVTFPFYDISLLSKCTCQSDYRHAFLRRHKQGLSNRLSTDVFGLRQSEHSAPFPFPTLTGVSV